MEKIIKNILIKNFELARPLIMEDFQKNHDLIIEEAFASENQIFCDFYKFLIERDLNNSLLYFALSELYFLVFNILPDGYDKSFKYINKAIELDSHNWTYKEFILLFYQLPKPLLSRESAIIFAQEVLVEDENNKAARLVIGKNIR